MWIVCHQYFQAPMRLVLQARHDALPWCPCIVQHERSCHGGLGWRNWPIRGRIQELFALIPCLNSGASHTACHLKPHMSHEQLPKCEDAHIPYSPNKRLAHRTVVLWKCAIERQPSGQMTCLDPPATNVLQCCDPRSPRRSCGKKKYPLR